MMDNGYATLRCTLKVFPSCDACKRHTMEILSSIVGAYDLRLDSERCTATIVGQVHPNFCIKALARCNEHAEVVRANLSHPKMTPSWRDRYDYDHDHDHDYYYDDEDIYWPRRSLMAGMYHDHPNMISSARRRLHSSIKSDSTTYRPNYPLIDYTIPHQLEEESITYCSVM